MKRDGFISIIALLLMLMLLVSGMYILHPVILQAHIVNNSQTNIQSRITADSNINRIVYDDRMFEDVLLPEIYYILRNRTPPYITDLDGNGIPAGRKVDVSMFPNIKSASLSLEGSEAYKIIDVPDNYDEITNLIIRINTEYESIKDTIEVKGLVFNKIFEIKEPHISEVTMLELDLYDEYDELMDRFENEIEDYDFMGTSSYYRYNFYGDGLIDKNNLTETIDGFESTYQHKGKHVMINIFAEDDYRPVWEIEEDVKLRGTIYCEGDLIISSKLDLEGNLILNKGRLIIDENLVEKPIIRGKVFARDSECLDIEEIKLDIEKKFVYRQGSYLPGFLDIKIDVIKR